MNKGLQEHAIMKVTGWVLLIAASCLGLATGLPSATSAPEAIVGRPDGKAAMFYDALAPHGDWFRHDRYGWVWRPRDVGIDWRPYTEGFWVYTDLGWTWQCEQDWGWAPFHYGRWAYEPDYGWIWMPDDVWAPAWVAWQSGDPWCGWAPLPPLVAWDFEPAWDALIPPFCWSFVEIRFLPVHELHEHIVPVARNVTLLHETRNVTKFVFNGDRQIVSSGVDPAHVERAIGRPLTRLHVENVASPVRGPAATIQKDRLLVFRPDFHARRQSLAARPTAPPVQGPPPAIVPAPTGPALSREFLQRQEVARRRLAEEQAVEAARLEEIHRRELANPPRGMSLPNLAQQHLEERRAFNEHVSRQNQLFEQRAQQGMAGHAGRDR